MIQGLYPILYIMSAYISDFALIVIGALIVFATFVFAWRESQDPTKRSRPLSERLPMPFEDPDEEDGPILPIPDVRQDPSRPLLPIPFEDSDEDDGQILRIPDVRQDPSRPRPLQDEDPCHID